MATLSGIPYDPAMMAAIKQSLASPKVPAQPVQVVQQGAPKVPTSVPSTQPPGGVGNAQYFSKGGTLPPGVTMRGSMPTATGYKPQPGDTVVQWPDGHQTILAKSGLSIDVPAPGKEAAAAAPRPSGAPSIPAPAGANKPTKVLGPQKVKDLLPAFSPPALNQFPLFYDPGSQAPVFGSSNVPAGYTGPFAQDIGSQASIAALLGVPWSAQTMNLVPGQSGYGMPPVDMTKGEGLKSNYVDPRLYGYVSPTLNPAWYQGARSTAK